MIKNVIYLILITLISTSVFAQAGTVGDDNYVLEEDEDYVLSFDSLKVKDKLHYGFTVGANFGMGSYGNYFSTLYRPTISYDVSSKLTISTGVTYVNSSVNNFPVIADYTYQLFSGNISQYYTFVGGKYKLTDKLSVGGSIFYDFTSYNTYSGASLNTSSGLDNLGYSAYFEYKVAKGFSIQGEIRVNDKRPYRQFTSPFSTGLLGGGFENSFFGR